MKFSKYNNTARKKRAGKYVQKRSAQYVEYINTQMQKLLMSAENTQQRRAILDAYSITLNP